MEDRTKDERTVEVPTILAGGEKKKSKRGFASMSPERLREISKSGGKAAHAKGTAHRWTSDEALEAGRKGGRAPHVRRGRGPGEKKDPEAKP